SGAFEASAAVAVRSESSVSVSTSCAEAVRPKPLPCVPDSWRISSLLLFSCSSASCFASAPTSPNVSVKSRSLTETRKPAPITPFCNAFHSCSVKSDLVAISTFLSGIMRTMPGAAATERLGLPAGIRACLFDLDGVLTPTALIHAEAWKQMFDAYLGERALRTRERVEPFAALADSEGYVAGKPRYVGVRSFLASRRIELPEGTPAESPGAETVCGLGNRKDELAVALMRKGVEPYPGSVRYVRAVRDAGLHRAVVSASVHCREVLEAAGIADLFEVRIDGIVAAERRLRGKPEPDTFLAAPAALQ